MLNAVHAATPTWNFVSDNRHCIWPHSEQPFGIQPTSTHQQPGNFPAINIANSMWTAGCCVHPNGVESFAVMGNNLQNVPRILTQQITVARLQMIFEHDEDNIGQNINGPNIDLFPGNVACSNVNNNHPALPPWNGR